MGVSSIFFFLNLLSEYFKVNIFFCQMRVKSYEYRKKTVLSLQHRFMVWKFSPKCKLCIDCFFVFLQRQMVFEKWKEEVRRKTNIKSIICNKCSGKENRAKAIALFYGSAFEGDRWEYDYVTLELHTHTHWSISTTLFYCYFMKRFYYIAMMAHTQIKRFKLNEMHPF